MIIHFQGKPFNITVIIQLERLYLFKTGDTNGTCHARDNKGQKQ